MVWARSFVCGALFGVVAGCSRASTPNDAPRGSATREEGSEIDLNTRFDDAGAYAGDDATLDASVVCAPDDPVVTLRARFAVYVTGSAPSITDTAFTGPRAAARVMCAADLALRARDRAASDGTTIHGTVLRRCDERPLPSVVRSRRTNVELVRESTSPDAPSVSALALMNVPRACLEARVTSAEVVRNPFESFEACEAIRARLEAKDREATASARASAHEWLDGQIAILDRDANDAREELAAFIARTATDRGKKPDPVEQEMRRIERERLERWVRNGDELAARVHAHRDREANAPIESEVKGACVRRAP